MISFTRNVKNKKIHRNKMDEKYLGLREVTTYEFKVSFLGSKIF